MLNLERIIKLVEEEVEKFKDVDCHINDDDSLSKIREKDMAFGKIVGAEHILELLKKYNS